MKLYQNLNVTGSLTLTGSLNTVGTITATTLVVQTITSSISSITGSTSFGSSSISNHNFTGSLIVSGAMFVSSSGNVGIGTTNPQSRLEIGNIGSAGTTDYGALTLSSGSSGLTLGWDSTNSRSYIYSRTALVTSRPLEINGAIYAIGFGNVGIGITSPTARLHVSGTSGALLQTTSGSTTGLFVSSSGNVGIGTTNPATRFDLSGSIGNFQIASSGAEIFLTRNENNDILATGGTSSGITIGAQSYVRFSVGTSYTERMRITSSGNVGIGTSIPLVKFQITQPNGIGLPTLGTSTGGLFIAGDGNQYGLYIGNDGNTGNSWLQAMRNNTATPYNILLNPVGGNVGIATTNPPALLSLKGRGGADIIFQMNDETDTRRCFYIPNQYYGYMWAVGVVSNGGKAFSFGNASGTEVGSIQITATSVNYASNSSDIRKKKNFENWEETVLPYFKDINPQKFNYTIEEDGESKTKGFIAQEMYDKFPEAYPLDLDGFHSFNPGGMVVYLMKAIQEQNALITDLRTEIEELKLQINK
jgi:hypothetical protein